MKTKRKLLVPAIIAVIVIVAAVIAFLPVFDVNVIFDRCVNADELATVFHATSFKTYQSLSVSTSGSTLSRASYSDLFGIPLEGAALDAALDAELRNAGVIVLDGSISLLDMIKIKKSPFVDDVVIYFPILDMGDRDVLPESSTHFFDKHPEARYWEE